MYFLVLYQNLWKSHREDWNLGGISNNEDHPCSIYETVILWIL